MTVFRRLCLLVCAAALCAALPCCARASVFDEDDSALRLVNREHKITRHYQPAELIQPDVPVNKKSQRENIYMRPEAARALEAMFAAAREEAEYTLLAVSGYRSFGVQSILFQNKVDSVGSRERAWRTVAPPGASEHQLGLAMDVVSDTFRRLNRAFLETDEGRWVNDNCSRFGFVIRYRAEWTEETGYAAEPWHVRYLGQAHAQALTRLNLSFEAYAAYASQWPEYVLLNADADLLYGLAADMRAGRFETVEALGDSAARDDREKRAVLERFSAYYANRTEAEDGAFAER